MLSDYGEYLIVRIVNAVRNVPEQERPNLYVVNLFVMFAEPDARYNSVLVSANTDARRRGAQQGVSDSFTRLAVAWDAHEFAYEALAEIGDPETDPEGAGEWRKYATTYLVGWDEAIDAGDVDADDVDALRTAFLGEVAEVGRVLHHRVLPQLLGRDPVITIDTDLFEDPLLLANQQANPDGLPDDALSWYRAREDAG